MTDEAGPQAPGPDKDAFGLGLWLWDRGFASNHAGLPRGRWAQEIGKILSEWWNSLEHARRAADLEGLVPAKPVPTWQQTVADNSDRQTGLLEQIADSLVQMAESMRRAEDRYYGR